MDLALLLALGLVVGLALGTFGAGGSVVAVPALVFVIGQDPATATTTSLVVVVVAATGGLLALRRSPLVRWRLGLAFAALTTLGALVGARLSLVLPGDVLLVAFGALMAAAALRMVRGACEDRPAEGVDLASPSVLAAATATGLLTGLFGVGGGFVIVPVLVLVVGLRLAEATATSLVVISVSATIALLGRTPTDLDASVVVPFAATAVVASLLGTRIAGRLDGPSATRAFAALLFAFALATSGTAAYDLVGADDATPATVTPAADARPPTATPDLP